MEVLIIGAGALGSYLGYVLSKTCSVTLVARGEHAKAMRTGGLKVRHGRITRNIRPRVVSRPVNGEWDMAVLTTKAYDAEKALGPALKVLGKDTAVVLFLNGLGVEERALKLLRRAKLKNPVIRGLTSHGFAIPAPGVVKHTGDGRTAVGAVRGDSCRAAELAEALNAGGLRNEVSKDIKRDVWIKAVVNASINPVAAAAGVNNGRLITDPELNEIMRKACYECAAVAAKEVKVSRQILWKRTMEVASLTSKNRNSMLQDLDKGRATEIDFITGEIVRRADKYGIPVPINRTLLVMIKARQAYIPPPGR